MLFFSHSKHSTWQDSQLIGILMHGSISTSRVSCSNSGHWLLVLIQGLQVRNDAKSVKSDEGANGLSTSKAGISASNLHSFNADDANLGRSTSVRAK